MSALQDLREALEFSGMKPEGAERIAYVLQSREFVRDNIATKEDLLILENKIEKEFSSVNTRIATLDTKAESLEKKLDELKKESKEDMKSIKNSINNLLFTVIGAVVLTWLFPWIQSVLSKLPT